MTTPRKPRPPGIRTARAAVSGAWVDTSVPAGIVDLLANLAPAERNLALGAIGDALGLFRDLDGDRRLQPSNAEAAADLEDLGKAAAGLRARLERVPTIAEALADESLHRAGRPLWSQFARQMGEGLRQLDNLSATIARRLRDLPKAGAAPAAHRRQLFDALAEVARDHGIAFNVAPGFADRAFKVLALKPPVPPRRPRKK